MPGDAHNIALEGEAAGDLFDLRVDPAPVSGASKIKRLAPIETREQVLKPAVRCLHWRSAPIADPQTSAVAKRMSNSNQVKCGLTICFGSFGQALSRIVLKAS
jgi:hypothetical protein